MLPTTAPEPAAIQGDVAKTADVECVLSEAARQFGPIDILVNNAGVCAFSAIESLSEEEFHRHINVNILRVLLAIREALKQTLLGAQEPHRHCIRAGTVRILSDNAS
jgi:NAD(P)-dependent dehydrogenase (short-subunit alcohol dehydrogenase family)